MFHCCKTSQRNLIPHHNGRLSFGTSVFHAYVHEWACQIKYNPRFNSLWGFSDSEGLERLWSFLSRLIAALRTLTRLHRLQAIQLCADFYTELNLQQSGKSTSFFFWVNNWRLTVLEPWGRWLLKNLNNAVMVFTEARGSLETLFQKMNPFNPGDCYTAIFLRGQWELEKKSQGSKDIIAQEQRLELARLISLEDNLREAWWVLFIGQCYQSNNHFILL